MNQEWMPGEFGIAGAVGRDTVLAMNSIAALAIGVGVGLGAGYLLFGAGGELSKAQAELADLRAATNSLGTSLTLARKAQLSDEELEKLESTHRDAIKMRGEMSNLKQQLSNAVSTARSAQSAADAARARAAEQEKALAESAAATQEKLIIPQTFSAKAAALMTPGQSLVAGAWPTGTGTVTFAFMSPKPSEQQPDTILVTGKIVEVPQEAAARLQGMYGNNSGGLTLNPEQLAALTARWEQTPGYKVLSSPQIMTQSGVQGSVSMGGMMPTANGPVHIGHEINVMPTLSPDGRVQLNVEAKLTSPTGGAQ